MKKKEKLRSELLWIIFVFAEIALVAGIIWLLSLLFTSDIFIVFGHLAANSVIPLMGSIILIVSTQILFPGVDKTWLVYILTHILCVLATTTFVYFLVLGFQWESSKDFFGFVLSNGLTVMIFIISPRLLFFLRPENLRKGRRHVHE